MLKGTHIGVCTSKGNRFIQNLNFQINTIIDQFFKASNVGFLVSVWGVVRSAEVAERIYTRSVTQTQLITIRYKLTKSGELTKTVYKERLKRTLTKGADLSSPA